MATKTAQQQIDDLTSKITKATTVETSAKTLIDGIQALITAAVAAAIANGATADQLQPVSDLADILDTESDALQASVTANTPVVPTP